MPIDDIEFRNAIFNFSITVTSKCNLKCSYCHFYEYGKHKNHEEISQKLFEKYVQFLEWLKIKNYNISYRFSGGEPLTIGERIFDLAQYSTERLKIAPYVMTNGLLLNEYVVAKSKNRISAYVVSMENPFDVDKGSIKSEINIKK
ncbi:MAG: radical SAM protein, partial [Oscillospiraceae bacterium]|nr:radical SAM protein [Oscillospiraceae bacterium]